MRKQYTAAFKAQLVREVLKEEKPLNQIAVENGRGSTASGFALATVI